jgi:hypothetical protein
MLVTRIGYVLIIGVIVAAAVAIVAVLRPERASEPAALEFQQVMNYSRYGVIERIETKGQTLTVHFRKDFDTKAQFGSDAHDFGSKLPDGVDLVASLTAAGVTVNGASGLQVTSR